MELSTVMEQAKAEHMSALDQLRKEHASEMSEMKQSYESRLEQSQADQAHSQSLLGALQKQLGDSEEKQVTIAEQHEMKVNQLEARLAALQRETSVMLQRQEETDTEAVSRRDELENNLKARDEELKALQGKMDGKETELVEVRQQLVAMSDRHEKASSGAQQLRHHLEQLSAQHDAELMDLAADRDALSERNAALQLELEKLSEEGVPRGRSAGEVGDEMVDSGSQTSDVVDDQNTLKKMEELQCRVTELVAEKARADEEVASMTTERDALRANCDRLAAENDSLQQQGEQADRTHHADLEKVKKEKQELEARFQETLQKEVTQREQVSESSQLLARMKTEAEQQQTELLECNRQIGTLQVRLQEMEANDAERLEALSQRAEEVKRLQAELARHSDVQAQLDKVNEETSAKAVLVNRLEEQIKVTKEELCQVKRQLELSKAEVSSRQMSLANLEGDLQRVREESQRERDTLQAAWEREKTALKEQLMAAADHELAAHKQLLAEKEGQVESVLVKCDSQARTLAEQTAAIQSLEKELERCRQESSGKEVELSRLQAERQESSSQLHSQQVQAQSKVSPHDRMVNVVLA